MKLADRGLLFSSLFLIQLHSSQPRKLAEFYEKTLSLRFRTAAYPYPCYRARLGRVVFVISGLDGYDSMDCSEPGRVTFGLLTEDKPSIPGERFFLPPKRPLGRAYPEQYATRVQDPDGNYVALACSMEGVMGRVPPVNSLSDLLDCSREYALSLMERAAKRTRQWLDSIADTWEYATNLTTGARGDISGYTHVLASREGLYVINSTAWKRILRGSFFGTTVKDGAIYTFQSCGQDVQNRGRILKLTFDGERVSHIEVIAKGLDDGCHQMDFIGEDLVVVDCYNARLLLLRPGIQGYKSYYPLGKITRAVATQLYHMNSVAGNPDGTVWVLLHNHNKLPSEILVLDRDFQPLRKFPVKAGTAHNIVFSNDEHEYLVADSSGARIISSRGQVTNVDMMRPRGISLDENSCVVGDSFFCPRPFRRYVPGCVHFFDRWTWKRYATLTLPAAPTEIRRIDGKDLSISNYLAEQLSSQAVSAYRGVKVAGD